MGYPHPYFCLRALFGPYKEEPQARDSLDSLLKGSWDLVTRVMMRVTILITTYNPN